MTSKTLISLSLFLSLFSFSKCGKVGRNCSDNIYSFNSDSAKVYPDKDSIQVGDTLWLEASTPTTVKDSTTGKTVDYANAENMGIAISMLLFNENSTSNPNPTYGLSDFDFAIKEGSYYTSNQYANNYLYDEANGYYNFKIAVIAHQTGLYALSISDAINVYRKDDKCTKASFSITFQQTDQHLYLYQNLYPNQEISEYERTHLYCFKVY